MRVQFSHSFVNLFDQCRMKWYLRYNIKPPVEENLEPTNPLYLGILLEDIVKDGVVEASENYYMKYPIINNFHVNEVIKAEYFADQISDFIGQGCEFEFKLESEDFIGYMDCIKQNEDGTYNIYDFKYSNYKENYRNSMQLHLYKYYFEKIHGVEVKELAYIMTPKILPRKDYDESIIDYRVRLNERLSEKNIEVMRVEYDQTKVDNYFNIIEVITDPDSDIERSLGNQCGYCEYSRICLKQEVV